VSAPALALDAAFALDPSLAALLPARARTFAFAARFLPRDRRRAAVVLYAFCRLMDDLVDEPPPGVDPPTVRLRLRDWADWLERTGTGTATGAPVPEPAVLAVALRALIEQHRLPTEYLLGLLSGLESDLDPVRMPDYDALRRYCFLVAGTVGLAMSHLLGARQPEALVAAAELGIAMQLTNILRDLGDDLRAGRCYLPADELAAFGYSSRRLAERAHTGRCDDALRALMRFQIGRVRRQYARGLAGIPLLPPEARPAILIAGRLYARILDVIEANAYDVFTRRAATSRRAKVYEACRTILSSYLPVRQPVAGAVSPRPERLAELTAWLR
jgi:phytoene synthase